MKPETNTLKQPATTAGTNELNGVDRVALAKTLRAIEAEPALAAFRFRARNHVVHGPLNRTELMPFTGAGETHREGAAPFVMDNDEPPVLLGKDRAPNPVEYVLHALLGCMTTTTLYKAAAAGIEIESMRSEIEGDLDLHGMLGLDPDVRPGYQGIRATLHIKTKGDREALRALHRDSPVFDTISRPVPITVDVVFEA